MWSGNSGSARLITPGFRCGVLQIPKFVEIPEHVLERRLRGVIDERPFPQCFSYPVGKVCLGAAVVANEEQRIASEHGTHDEVLVLPFRAIYDVCQAPFFPPPSLRLPVETKSEEISD